MNDITLGLRHRSAACHLSSFLMVSTVWLPLLLRRSAGDQDGFFYRHATGAALYQGLSVSGLGVLWLCRDLPLRGLDAAGSTFMLALLGVIGLCLLGLYFLGSLCLAFQAWNGDGFWAPVVTWLMPSDELSQE